jgi:hypothetical protein
VKNQKEEEAEPTDSAICTRMRKSQLCAVGVAQEFDRQPFFWLSSFFLLLCVCVCVLLSAAADRKESRPALLYNSEREAKNRPGISTIWHRLLSPLSQRTTPTVHTHTLPGLSLGGEQQNSWLCVSRNRLSAILKGTHTHTHTGLTHLHTVFLMYTHSTLSGWMWFWFTFSDTHKIAKGDSYFLGFF